jgi:hypothetical protein
MFACPPHRLLFTTQLHLWISTMPSFCGTPKSYISPFPPHYIHFSMVCDFASSFYMILCMRLLPIHAYIHGMQDLECPYYSDNEDGKDKG